MCHQAINNELKVSQNGQQMILSNQCLCMIMGENICNFLIDIVPVDG